MQGPVQCRAQCNAGQRRGDVVRARQRGMSRPFRRAGIGVTQGRGRSPAHPGAWCPWPGWKADLDSCISQERERCGDRPIPDGLPDPYRQSIWKFSTTYLEAETSFITGYDAGQLDQATFAVEHLLPDPETTLGK